MSINSDERMLDISELLSGVTDVIHFDESFDTVIEENGITVSGFVFSGSVSGKAKLFRIIGNVCCVLHSDCARCLKPVEYPFKASLDRPLSSENEDGSDDEERVLINNDKIDIFSIAYEKLLLDLPFRLLCKDDCKGICSKCGKDLNSGKCDCSEKEVDPRLAGLSDFFK